ncbi:MAG: hypothetical protein ACO3LE_09235, partial [Bdellovibrionota bacterium]
ALTQKLMTHSSSSSFREKIENLEARFLQMNFESLLSDWKNLETEMKNAAPYQNRESDFSRLYELRAYIGFQEEDFKDSAYPIYFFSKDENFKKKMPPKLQAANEASKIELREDFYIFGAKSKSIQVPDGDYFAEKWEFPYFVSGVLKIKSAQASFHELHRKKVSELWDAKSLQQYLKASRPQALRDFNIHIEIDKNQVTRIPAEEAKPVARNSRVQIKPEKDLSSWFYEDEKASPSSEFKLFKSPWFWVALGAVAAGGAYWAYESNRGPTIIKTP